MAGTRTTVQVAGATVACATITGLVGLSVHPVPAADRLGTLPRAAALWAVYAAGAWLVCRSPRRWALGLILIGGIAIQLAALSAPPRGSDDAYRYIWDGKVQAAGIDPYRYPPAAPQLVSLRDPFLWPAQGPYCVAPGTRLNETPAEPAAPGCTRINRPTVPTIYPPVAEGYFTAVQYLSPSSGGTFPIQAAAAACAVAVTGLLLAGRAQLGKDPRLAVLWAWCPTVALEAGNSAHVDVLAAGLAAAALLVLAGAHRLCRSLAGGVLLALAIWAKVTPVLMMPAVLRRRPAAVVTAALAATAAVYLPHALAVGGGVIGFLPGYLHQEGYANGTRFVLIGLLVPGRAALAVAITVLAAVALAVLLRSDPDQPWRGAVVMTGLALAVTTPPFPWYTLLLVVLVAFDGRAEWLAFAAVRYLTFQPLLPGVHVQVVTAERVGYGTALVLVMAASLIRWRQARRAAAPAPAQASPRPAETAQIG
jgi:Glycosyltransferase family 87